MGYGMGECEGWIERVPGGMVGRREMAFGAVEGEAC